MQSAIHKTDQRKNPWPKIRMVIWVLIVIFELALFAILLTAGWDGTTMIVAGSGAVLPLIVGLVSVLYRGRKFSIRSLLIATGCVALFIVITIQPLLNAQRERSATLKLQEAGVQIGQLSQLNSNLRCWGLENVKQTKASNEHLPHWVGLVSPKLIKAEPNNRLVYLTANRDSQLVTISKVANELTSVRLLRIDGATPLGLRFFLENIGQFESLEAITFYDCQLPEESLEKLSRMKFLQIVNRTGATSAANETQLETIASSSNLLGLQVEPMSEAELSALNSNRSLRKLRVFSIYSPTNFHRGDKIKLSPFDKALQKFIASHPDCEVEFYPR